MIKTRGKKNTFFRAQLFVLSVLFSNLILKASSLQILTGERGLKNPIQRTTFYLQRSSGARVMVDFMSLRQTHSVSERHIVFLIHYHSLLDIDICLHAR